MTIVLNTAVVVPNMKLLISAIAPVIASASSRSPISARVLERVTMNSFCWRRNRIRWPAVGATSNTVASATVIRTPK